MMDNFLDRNVQNLQCYDTNKNCTTSCLFTYQIGKMVKVRIDKMTVKVKSEGIEEKYVEAAF
jgi:hypothetical protein